MAVVERADMSRDSRRGRRGRVISRAARHRLRSAAAAAVPMWR
jgi:hypothetical protein